MVVSGVSLLFVYLILSLQGHLPLNPQHFSDVTPALAFNTAISFATNTNWQTTCGRDDDDLPLADARARHPQLHVGSHGHRDRRRRLIRGFANRGESTIGNFWVDLTRANLYILFPFAFVLGIVFVAQGAVDTLSGPILVHNALTGVTQTIPRGPAGFMEAIKQFGTNGGGFFNINSAHPFENPTGITDFLSIVALLSIPFALTYTFGKMVGHLRQGVAVLVAMVILYAALIGVSAWPKPSPTPRVTQGGVATQVVGQHGGQGRPVRGPPMLGAVGVSSTVTSTGSACGSYDSFNPMGGFAA